MKIYKYWIAIYLLSFTLQVNENCSCRSTEIFVNEKVALFNKYDIICLEGQNLEIELFVTNYGKFDQSNGEVRTYLCDTTGQDKLILKMSPEVNYVIIKSQNTNKKMLLVISTFGHESLKNPYVYRGKYFQYDLECFHQTHTNINDLQDEIKNKFHAELFKNKELTLSCIWFNNANDANIIIKYNKEDLSISLMKRHNNYSYFFQSLKTCSNSMNLEHDNVINQNMFILSYEQRYFCMNEEGHMIETIRRKYSDNSKTHWNDYCSYKGDKNLRYCIQVGKDFEYALISTDNHLKSTLVISHNAHQNVLIDPASSSEVVIVIMDTIICGKPKFQFTDAFWDVVGWTHEAQNEYCIVPSLLNGKGGAYYQVGTERKYLLINGCETSTYVELTDVNTLKLENLVSTILLPVGNTIIRYVSAPSFNFDKYTYHDTKICGIKSFIGIYYMVSPELNYSLIVNEYNHKTKLVYRNGIINEECSESYLYNKIYFKSEALCIPHSQIADVSQLNDKNYVHVDGNKAIFIVDLMNLDDIIHLNPSEEVASLSEDTCHGNKIRVDRTRTRPNIEENGCENMYTDTHSQTLNVYTKEVLDFCIRITCSKPLYYFSQLAIDSVKEKREIIECNQGSNDCLDHSNSQSIVYKIRSSLHGKEIFVSSESISEFYDKNQDILYEPDYYKNEIVCFQSNKIQEKVDPNVFQLTNQGLSCSIIKELEEDTVTINVQGKFNCLNEITLHKLDPRPDSENTPLKLTCQYLLNPDSQPKFVDPSSLSVCITKTCSQIMYVVDISSAEEAVTYDISTCSGDDTSQNNCLNIGINGAIMKVTTSSPSQANFLYTKKLTSSIQQSYYYDQLYGPNLIVCLDKNRIFNVVEVKAAVVTIEYTHKLCILNDEVKTKNTDVLVQLKIDETCKRSISISSASSSSSETLSNEIETKCNRFIVNSIVKSEIITENIQEVKECITSLCLKVFYLVKGHEEVMDCENSNCDVAQPDINFFKIYSVYNDKSFYIILKDTFKNEIMVSNKSRYYESSYYAQDIVCYKTNFLNQADTQSDSGYIIYDENTSCFIPKDLSETKTITLQIPNGCSRTITLHNTNRPIISQQDDTSLDRICGKFNVVDNSQFPISMSLTQVQQCVVHLCLQPIFIVKYQRNHDNDAAIREKCNVNSQQCVSEATSFDYVKLQNSYTEELFYVINSEPREFVIPEKYFYSSPFYDSEVICIKPARIPTVLKDLTMSNSYDLHENKCVILKELDSKTTFQIVTNKCTRDISITTKDSGVSNFMRSLVAANCKDILSTRFSHRKVHNMTNEYLTKCMAHTCSHIVSRVLLQKDKPLIHSPIQTCYTPSVQCLINNEHYDFIKIESTMFEGSRYFRNFDSSLVSQYTAKTTEIYDSQYTEGDIVCFKAKDVIGPDGWLELPGVFIEPPRICIIPQELQNDIYIYIYLEYKITSEYYQNISIKKSSHQEGEINKSTAKTECPHFFDQSNPQLLSYESSKNELLSCIQRTYSFVYFLVEIKLNEEGYVHKRLRMCNQHTDVSLCFNEIDVFDSVKVKSPFRTDSFYVRSMDLQKPTLEIFKNYFYQQTYYPDDFVCFHHDLLSSQDRLTQTGILISSSVSCLVVRDLTNTPSITIKMFDKCSKNIEFSTKEFKSPTKIEINCSLFYNSITDTTNIATTMSISDLRTCIELTCSKISSVYVNSKNGDVFKKTMKNCNGEPEYGDATCLKDLDHYYLAKIQRGVDDAIIYLQEESVHNFDESLYDPYFYSSKYFNNEVVCVNRKNLEPESKLVLIQTGNANLVCLIIKDLEISTLKLKTSNNCKKEIVLDRINPRPEIEELFQDNCKFFYSNPNKEDNILEMGVEGFKQCIAKTCSKIISYIKRNDKTTTYTIDNITLCSGQYGDSDCVVGEHYDFAVIENSYLSYPAIVRSIDFDAIQPQKISHIFQRSVYYNTEIVCLASKMILNLQLIVNQAGVYSKTQRTCIIGSQISTDVTLELSVNGKCNQTLFVTSSSKSESKHPTLKLDEDCKAYYHHEQTLLVQSYDTIIKCVAHTCASVEFMNQTIIDHGNDDKCDKSSTGCQDQNEFTYAFVNLISNPKPILVMSPEIKNRWINSFDNVDTHISNNNRDKIQCFKENSIDTPESITDAYINHESNILCIDMKDTDTQVLMTNDNDSQAKISIIRSKDQTINDITSKDMKISIYADIQSTGKMLEIFKYNVTLDIKKKENNISSIDQLESCIVNQTNILTEDHVHKPNVDDLYAFIIRSNIVFKSSLIFMKRNKSACAKYYSGIENLPTEFKQSNTKLHNFECLIVSRDTLTSNAKDYTPNKNLNKTESCLNRDDLIKRCSKMYDYSDRIIVCYKIKIDAENDEIEEDDSPQLVEVMIRNEDCYISKIIRHDRVAICNINEHGISVQIVDFDLRIEEQVLKSVAAKIQNNLWVFGVSGICLIALALVYSVSRRDNVDQYKLDGGNAYMIKMTTH